MVPQAPYGVGDGGFPGGVQGYPVTQPAYAVAQPAYTMGGEPTFMGQSAAVHGVAGAQYGAQPPGGVPYGQLYAGYAGGYSAAPPPHTQHQAPHRPPPQRPNHAAGGRTPYSPKPTAAQYDVEAGGFGEQTVSPFMAKAEKEMRMAFIRKVYAILSCQLLLSALFCAYVTLDGAANAFVLSHPGLYILGLVASVAVLLLLMCYRNYYPINLGLLAIWTVCMCMCVRETWRTRFACCDRHHHSTSPFSPSSPY
jgi:hypothetical protein